MGIFEITLLLSTLLCSLVAGFLFGFTVVTMPGLGSLNDGEFIRAFQVMDRVIQNNHPLFILVWVGSAVTLLAGAILGFGQLEPSGRVILILATFFYLFGVQLPTIFINIPLNNRLQAFTVMRTSAAEHKAARAGFERRWNQWNIFRTGVATLTSALLIFLVYTL